MKKRLKLLLFILLSIFLFNVYAVPVKADTDTIYLGGMPAGFSLRTKGVKIVGFCDVITKNGLKSPAKDCEIKVGDIILSIGEHEINCAMDIEKALKNSNCRTISIKRNESVILEKFSPAKDLNGNYRLGVFVKDSIDGIGTITFIKGNRFASLGHPVVDENGQLLDIAGGELYKCDITGCVKGEKGKAGELRGVFTSKNKVATIDMNCNFGVFGNFENKSEIFDLIKIETGKAKMGSAHIYSTVTGEKPEKFDISIIKTDYSNQTKNFVIKINDDRLIDCTGGIVQGMSGSPIVQNGKLVGAVTHVFVNDPTRGFGISIENMIDR